MPSLRSVHTCNIANVAYGYCKILRDEGASVELYCHDMTHVMSQPEWDDLDLSSDDFRDENNFYDNTADFVGYYRPEWFHSAPLLSLLYDHPKPLDDSESAAPIDKKISSGFSWIFLTLLSLYRLFPEFLKRYARSAYYKFNMGRKWWISRTELESRKLCLLGSSATKSAHEFLKSDDFDDYLLHADWIAIASRNSDVIFAYVLSPIYAMIYGKKPYVAVEIGTMRDIPFEKSARGRLLYNAYHEAGCVLITNPDVKAAADRIGLSRYLFCPHPVDEDRYSPMDASLRKRLRDECFEKESDFILLAPARQNWELKGNEKYFLAIKQCIDEGMKLAVYIPAWGQEIQRSKDFCVELGIEANVVWIKPLSEGGLIKYFSACDVVLDQFNLGVFGLVTPKALACGVPVITSYDFDVNSWCFENAPPVFPANTPEEISEHIRVLYKNRNDLSHYQKEARDWFLENHSKKRVAEILRKAENMAVDEFIQRDYR